jgi:hypothetical protein
MGGVTAAAGPGGGGFGGPPHDIIKARAMIEPGVFTAGLYRVVLV